MSRPLHARNPRTGEFDYTFIALDAPEVETLAVKARSAQADWGALPLAGRIETLLGLSAAIADRSDAIIAALAADTGRKRIAEMEVAGVITSTRMWAARTPDLLPTEWTAGHTAPHIKHRSQFVPYALIGVISPWNFPLTLSMIDTLPALFAGCSVLLKPSEVTPRFAAPLAEAIDSAGLSDIFQIVRGDGETGAALSAVSDAICFTGSVATGRKVAAACADHLIPAFLELGGKDPLIITASAELETATDAALRGSVLSTGQACQSIERIYVQHTIHDAFVARLQDKSDKIEFNWPDISKGTLGPIIFDQQADILTDHINDAKAKGAHVLTGGMIETHGGGKWLKPTLLSNVNHDMKVMREETFGPVLPVMAYHSEEEAIALANDTEFGLSAGVVAGTLEEAERIGRQIDAGAISLNDAALTSLFHEAEKHSFKHSGMGGSRMGAAGFARFFRRKALIANTASPVPLSSFAEDFKP